MRFTVAFPLQPFRLSGLLLAAFLLLAAGCAQKTVIQSSPVPASPAPSAPSPTITEVLLARFEAWKGVPHRFGGTDRRGIDCSGLMQAVFREAFDMDLPRTSRDQSRMGRQVAVGDMRPGDLVFFRDKGGDHIGVLVHEGRFLHVSSTLGVTVSELDAYWRPRLRDVRRVLPPGLTSADAGS